MPVHRNVLVIIARNTIFWAYHRVEPSPDGIVIPEQNRVHQGPVVDVNRQALTVDVLNITDQVTVATYWAFAPAARPVPVVRLHPMVDGYVVEETLCVQCPHPLTTGATHHTGFPHSRGHGHVLGANRIFICDERGRLRTQVDTVGA